MCYTLRCSQTVNLNVRIQQSIPPRNDITVGRSTKEWLLLEENPSQINGTYPHTEKKHIPERYRPTLLLYFTRNDLLLKIRSALLEKE